MTLSWERRIELIGDQSAALGAAVAAGDPGDPVPSCPGWSLHDLLLHHGNVLRGWAAVVTASDPSAPPAWMVDGGAPPWALPTDDARGWYVASRLALRDALAASGPDAAAWTWWGEPATVGAIARHQVQEACVHRWDAESAAGVAVSPLPHDAAVDGVEERLAVVLPVQPPAWEGPPTRVGLHAEGAEPWLLVGADGAVTARPYSPGPGQADAVVRASASDAVLLLHERIGVSALEVDGDRDAARALLA